MDRRTFLAGLSLSPLMLGAAGAAVERVPTLRQIPKTGERIPAIGMGTWITFDVGGEEWLQADRCQVLETFFKHGGRLVDSSPMYGSAEAVLGHCLARVPGAQRLFSATKVWTYGQAVGRGQMANSQRLWGVKGFDLMQIHNMLDWRDHLETLRQMKADGQIRYIGITTSHGRRHRELEQVMREEGALDFVQFTYNIEDREAEQRLLPLATEQGLAVIVNRPFQGGNLFARVAGKPLPEWAADIGCDNWAQFFLKFVISHPAVTCAIPATSRVDHMQQNMGALYGKLPDETMRPLMVQAFERL